MAKKGKKGMDSMSGLVAKGMSKADDPRKHNPKPIKGSGFGNKEKVGARK